MIAQALAPDSPAASLVESLREELRATVVEVRRVVEGLRPPAIDELGLARALGEAVRRLTIGTSLEVELQIHDLPQLPAAAEVAAFRIVTEAVTNVVRHARATTCGVEVSVVDESLRVAVTDNGVGVKGVAEAGNGLQTMRERAEEMGGQMYVTNGVGTQVLAILPVSARRARPSVTEPSLPEPTARTSHGAPAARPVVRA